MVVIVIIGIILSFVFLSFGDFGRQRRLNATSQHLSELIKLLSVRSIIGADTYGVNIQEHGYAFFKFVIDSKSPYGRWQPLTKKRLFKEKTFLDNTTVSINREKKHDQPEVIVSPSGELTPFIIEFRDGEEKTHITSDGSGNLKVTADEK